MFKGKIAGLIIFALLSSPGIAFETVDEQIDHYLKTLSKTNVKGKIEMLERLQWSGLTDSRFYDVVESNVLKQYLRDDLSKNERTVLGHQIRALGFSGNEKYRATLKLVKEESYVRRNKGYGKKALADMNKFSSWNKLIAESNFTIEGKSAEVTTYMKMLNTDNPSVQKLAARAIFHEEQDDNDLLVLTAEKLKAMYLKEGLDRGAQDSAAWLSKALGQNGGEEFIALLIEVVDKTPYKQIRKHAAKYVP